MSESDVAVLRQPKIYIPNLFLWVANYVLQGVVGHPHQTSGYSRLILRGG